LLFHLADARGRVLGFQARKLREDDPCARSTSTRRRRALRKGDLLYGLDRARAAIAKAGARRGRRGEHDVLALRQAGVEPVVASMGTR
jgi:DNA primase